MSQNNEQQYKLFELISAAIPEPTEKDERITKALNGIREHLDECKRKYDAGKLYDYQKRNGLKNL